MGTIDLAALEIFKTVAEHGGITKAAARLHRVQSNVTTRVKQLEAWLGAAGTAPDRVMEFASYHAIVACVAAGAGIAIVPRSVLRVARVSGQISTHALPADVARARTCFIWRRGHRSVAADALRRQLGPPAARPRPRPAPRTPAPARGRRC